MEIGWNKITEMGWTKKMEADWMRAVENTFEFQQTAEIITADWGTTSTTSPETVTEIAGMTFTCDDFAGSEGWAIPAKPRTPTPADLEEYYRQKVEALIEEFGLAMLQADKTEKTIAQLKAEVAKLQLNCAEDEDKEEVLITDAFGVPLVNGLALD